jgi:hypothetical protein
MRISRFTRNSTLLVAGWAISLLVSYSCNPRQGKEDQQEDETYVKVVIDSTYYAMNPMDLQFGLPEHPCIQPSKLHPPCPAVQSAALRFHCAAAHPEDPLEGP